MMRLITFSALSLALVAVLAACGSERTPGGVQDPDAAGSTSNSSTGIPLQPVMRLHYGGQVYDGVPGNFCWPSKPGVSVCGVETAFPWQDLDISDIPVTSGDSIVVEIEADERPLGIRAAIFTEASDHASDTAEQVVELPPGFATPLVVELTPGIYNVRITGQWGVGDQAYKFRIKVE